MPLPRNLTDKEGRPFLLRALETADRPALDRMYDALEPKRVAQGLPPEDERQRRRWLDSVLPTGSHLVVVVDGRIAGHGMLIPFGDAAVELANFLHQAVRDRGIGTALNRTLLEVATGMGARRAWLSVEPWNRAAIRSYEKAGFRHRAASAWAPEVEMEVVLPSTDDS